jgi:1,4-dihydroxy-2-naphthoyl-CoA hydrolase
MTDQGVWHSHLVRVRFQDVDAAGIVFFARVFDLFHDAYVEALRAHGIDLARVLDERTWAAPLTACDAKFRRPMRFGDELRVDITAELVGRDLVLRYRVRAASDAAIEHASGSTTHAFVNRASFTRIDAPEELRVALRSAAE